MHVGTNNLTKKSRTGKEIVKEIIDVVNLCHNGGVNNVIVSGLTNRPSFQSNINEINRLLQLNAGTHNYKYLDNSNIRNEHLWKDKLHLNEEGIILIANNVLNTVNKHSFFDNFY